MTVLARLAAAGEYHTQRVEQGRVEARHIVDEAKTDSVHIAEALRLSPLDPFSAAWLSIAGDAKLFLGRDEEAVARLSRAVALNRNNPYTYFLLAAALAQVQER